MSEEIIEEILPASLENVNVTDHNVVELNRLLRNNSLVELSNKRKKSSFDSLILEHTIEIQSDILENTYNIKKHCNSKEHQQGGVHTYIYKDFPRDPEDFERQIEFPVNHATADQNQNVQQHNVDIYDSCIDDENQQATDSNNQNIATDNVNQQATDSNNENVTPDNADQQTTDCNTNHNSQHNVDMFIDNNDDNDTVNEGYYNEDRHPADINRIDQDVVQRDVEGAAMDGQTTEINEKFILDLLIKTKSLLYSKVFVKKCLHFVKQAIENKVIMIETKAGIVIQQKPSDKKFNMVLLTCNSSSNSNAN